MAVGNFNLPIISSSSSGGNLTPEPYVRPVDWLTIDPLVSPGDQKIVILAAVFEDSNFVGLECSGNYTVDWGDGTIVNTSAGTDSYHQYDWNYSGFTGTLTSRGYKQAIITITPQIGQNLTLARLNKKNLAQAGLPNGYTHPWLDIKMSAPLMSQLRIGLGTAGDPIPRLLEQFDWIGTNQLTSVINVFNNAFALKQVKNFYTSLVTNFTSFFAQCYDLEHIPFFNTSLATGVNSMFINCYKLKSVPLFDFSNSVQFVSTFSNCVSIVEFPNFNCINGNLFTTMFDGCRSMIKNPALIMNTGSKGLTGMFANCFSMVEFVNLNINNGTVYSQMFQNCYSLRILPTLNVTTSSSNVAYSSMFQNCYDLEVAPMMDLSKGGDCSTIFSGCLSIIEFPPYDFSSATTLQNAFASCVALKRLPVMIIGTGTTNFVTTFNACSSLEEAPNWNLQSATNITNMFNGCGNLRKVPSYNLANVTTTSPNLFANNFSLIQSNVTGMRYTHTYANCKLSRTELVDIFNNLGTAVGAQTITISGNYGASSLTAGERAIATGKGWTIVG